MKVMGNDLSRGLFPAKEVKLLIVDEAHKAQGDYAYCLVARLLHCLFVNLIWFQVGIYGSMQNFQ